MLLAIMLTRMSSRIERTARSATPFSWCTCGGQVVWLIPSEARRSLNSCERNSAALSQCTAPRTMEGLLARELTTDLRVAMYSLAFLTVSDLFLRQ